MPSTAVMSIHVLQVTASSARTPSTLGLASFWEVVSSPHRSSLWGFLGAIGKSEHPLATEVCLGHLVLSVSLDLILFLAREEGSDERPFAAGPH